MRFLKKYRHGFWMAGYAAVYLILFYFLEHRQVGTYHIIHSFLDDKIPFCEYFVIPYLLWFPYQFLAILFFIFRNPNRREYYRLAGMLCMGMTLFLIVSFLYPNGHHLRPDTFARDNLFVHLVQLLYAADTPTNILPSIHVYNSLTVHMAICNCQALQRYRFVRAASFVLTLSIVLSTMFLKQHSVVDVISGTGLAFIGYFLFYRQPHASEETAAGTTKHASRSPQ